MFLLDFAGGGGPTLPLFFRPLRVAMLEVTDAGLPAGIRRGEGDHGSRRLGCDAALYPDLVLPFVPCLSIYATSRRMLLFPLVTFSLDFFFPGLIPQCSHKQAGELGPSRRVGGERIVWRGWR
jgi:hypothetical protein